MVGGAAEGVSRRRERTGNGGHPIRRRAKRQRVGTTAIRGQPARAPWCSNHSHRRYPRVLPKAEAKRCRYIQPQPPWVRVWLIFDYDRDGAWCAADEAGGRGNPWHLTHRIRLQRSIPAWAGKPRAAVRADHHREVYPRVGGETWGILYRLADNAGLSPRGRGNQPHPRPRHQAERSIPAWAGKPDRD